jgi:RNA polymerase sigma-70 factor (ECF subfamily)
MQADPKPLAPTALDDAEVIRRVKEGEPALYEIVMRRYNQRLYRVVRSILGNAADVEDVVQEAWVQAYRALGQFEGRSSFATWLTKIAVHEALARARRSMRLVPLPDGGDDSGSPLLALRSPGPDPEQDAARHELLRLVEEAVEKLPDSFREVFVLREVEQLSQAETAECLGLREETVKTRLHRARARIESHLLARTGQALRTAFAFGQSRCDRIVGSVLARIGGSEDPAP